MSCRYTYKGKTYEAHEFDDVLRAMAPAEAAKFMPGVQPIPSAPFVQKTDAWVALAIKRVVKMAVDEGYDRVAFVNGEQSAGRYDLSKQVRSIAWGPNGDTKAVSITPLSGNDIEFNVRPDGVTVPKGRSSIDSAFTGKKLDEVVGKDIADKILADKHGDLSGNGLRIGGEGMKAFYDKIVPTVAKDVLKKLGGGSLIKVDAGHRDRSFAPGAGEQEQPDGRPMAVVEHPQTGMLTIELNNDAGYWGSWTPNATNRALANNRLRELQDAYVEKPHAQLGFDITPAMREKASGGMALFTALEARPFFAGPKYKGKANAAQAKADAEKVLGFQVPTPVLMVSRPDKGDVPMWYVLETKTIEYNRSVKRSRAADVQYMLEELLHAADHVGAKRTMSASNPRFLPGGDIRSEIEKAMQASAAMRDIFEYPIDEKNYSDTQKAAELFARIGVLYHGNPALLKASAPTTHEAYEQAFGLSGSRESVSGQIRQLSAADAGNDRGGEPVEARDRSRGTRRAGDQHASGNRLGQADGLQRIRADVERALGGRAEGGLVDFGRQGPPSLETHTAPASAPNPPPAESTFRAFQRKAQDQFNRFTVIRDWAKDQGVNLTPDSDVWAFEERMHGRIATRVEDFREKRVKPAIQAIQKAGFTMEQVGQFLHAQHAEERNKQIESIDPSNKSGSGMTTVDANAILTKADPKLVALANDLRKITNESKAILLKAGIVDKDMTDAWEKAYKHYVPLKGGEDAAHTGTGKGLSAAGKQKRAMGHSEREEHIVENILRDHERAITLAEKNTVGHSLLAFIAELGNSEIATIGQPVKRKVLANSTDYEVLDGNGGRIAIFDSLGGANQFITKHSSPGLFGKLAVPLTAHKVKGDPVVTMMSTPMLADNEVNVYVKGHAIRVQLNDELLARAYTRSGTEGLNQLMAMNRTINRYFSQVYTGYNPEFLLTNIARDFTTGLTNVTGQFGAGVTAKAVANYPKAFATLLRYGATGHETAEISQYRAAGGSTGAAYLSDIERLGKDVQAAYDEYNGVIATLKGRGAVAAGRAAARKFIGHMLGWLEHINAAGESAMRLAVFEAVRDTKGYTVNDAASASKNSTVNFNRRGEWGGVMGALYLFFNPAVQGTAAIADSLLKGKHKGQAIALTGSLAVLSYALSALQFGGGDDDDDAYNAIPDNVKDKNIVIRTGPKTYITIPMAYGYGFFYALGNAIYQLQKGRDVDKVALNIASALLEHFSPVGNPLAGDKPDMRGLVELVPGAVGGDLMRNAVRVAANRNSFGSDIVPDSPFDQGKPDNLRMFRTSKGTPYEAVASGMNTLTGGTKALPGLVDVSPETLKYWTRTVVGGAGAFVADTFNLARLAGRYVKNTDDPDRDALVPDRREIPIARRFAKEETIQDKRRLFWDAANDVKAAITDLERARKANDKEGHANVVATRGELVAMGEATKRQIALVKARRDLVDEVMGDENTSVAYKRARVKALEKEEATLYNDYVRAFAEQKRQAEAIRKAVR